MALKPFMRWVGGKIWFTKHIDSLLPDFVRNGDPFDYGEPFLGGGSIYIHMQDYYYLNSQANSLWHYLKETQSRN